MSESQLAKTKEGKRLLSKREQLSNEYAKSDLKASLVKSESPTAKFAESGRDEEQDTEDEKHKQKQDDLLTKIEHNTNPDESKIGRAHV